MFGARASTATGALKNIIDAFRTESFPLLGVKGHNMRFPSFDVEKHILQHASATGGADQICQALEKQHDFLLSAGDEEEAPRMALAGWRLLADRYAEQPMSPLVAADAVEDGAMHIHKLVSHREVWELDAASQVHEEQGAQCPFALDKIARQVKQEHPQIFRQEPFEWVYQGYAPLVLPAVLTNRKGMSLSLATLILAVLRRLGLSATLRFVEPARLDVAALAGVGQLATAPEAPRVFVCGGDAQDPVLLDPTKRRGTSWIVDGTEAALLKGASEWDANAVFRMWAEHARTMIVACQRRGESDAVASWMYQHAALDPERAHYPV